MGDDDLFEPGFHKNIGPGAKMILKWIVVIVGAIAVLVAIGITKELLKG